FSAVPVHLPNASEFVRTLYHATQTIPAGEVLSYGDLAEKLGNAGATRAVGSALGKNPIPLIIPCHRVVAASGKLGGFSSPGGTQTKLKLLDAEGVCLIPPATITNSAQWKKSIAQLQKNDALFAKMAKLVKPFAFQPHLRDEPVAALTEAIVSQQLATKVAATILARVNSLIQIDGVTSAERILQLPEQTLRGAGLSQMKVSFLKDLAAHYSDGKLSPLDKLQKMSDEQIIKEFTQIKGVGRWTVEMFLIFNLGRADVFPVLDFGVRKGVAKLYGLKEMPSPKEMLALGENWRPYRSVASLYLWRYQDDKLA
ncbi:MAG TPA: methylated-DNA--[protein]-cysteine S-methyltransferase, partial [Pseudomonadales bacterium]|nr:methylated-DNA--[protein]-cysteine S-methyltransferase [Pseudomonadales bacterium]